MRRISYLLDTLVKAILTYGAEIWGWREGTEVEKMTGRYVKMMMGLAKNMPTYEDGLKSFQPQHEDGSTC